ncbi:MAG: pyridinium-3,5-bisthiocarboxylic acid mononucleotide nickel chelatase, partial [Actinomycetota bacterium]|nr:pyridinium-3,5-bisthiocarboxylic acid mononucleotide nickel chelatase [Actinomycetota bacterium]
MTVCYFDCIGGAAGDMILAALVDCGASREDVTEAIAALDLGATLTFEKVSKNGIRALKASVQADDSVTQRAYKEVRALLEHADLEDAVRTRALEVFELLARAEAKVHDSDLDDVHFHEVGAVDALVDIVGSCAALESLDVDTVVCSPIPTGRGFVQSQHGPLPLPAPAVVEILHGAPMFERGDVETITPTGAALLQAFASEFGPMPGLKIEASGYGAGARDLDIPNVLRVVVGEETPARIDSPNALILEANLDDMTPELVPYVIDSLLEAGAHDAWATPIVMKKGRPAVTIAALCDPTHKWHLMEILYRETTTLGIRLSPLSKDVI